MVTMKRSNSLLFLLLLCVSLYASSKQDTLKASLMNILPNKEVVINKDIDLCGKVLPLPKGVTLNFKGGVFKNGTIIGNKTKIKCKKQAFEHVVIKGTWNVPKIYSTWFKDLSYINALQNVIALTNRNVKNEVHIAKGNYLVKVDKSGQTCLSVTDNTELVLNGSIRLLPNSFSHYYIINIMGNNVKISGNGIIIGDKHTHTGSTGEWGMGINLKKASNVSISGLTIKDCWGDCIYIGNNSKNVLIEKCTLDHGRRQGISVTSCNQITLRDLKITNVGGTNPEYGIDIEPNKNETVDNVCMLDITISKCKGGIAVYGKANEAKIGTVIIKNCIMSDLSKVPISVVKCKFVKITGCTLSNFSNKQSILLKNVECVYNKNNTIRK